MDAFTLHDLQCFDAVVRGGGFEGAAKLLHRSHPAVFTAVAKLERQLDLQLFDRTGYRVRVTDAGRAFHERARSLLREASELDAYAAHLAAGEESELRVVIGDLCPRPRTLALLSGFFARCPKTRLSGRYVGARRAMSPRSRSACHQAPANSFDLSQRPPGPGQLGAGPRASRNGASQRRTPLNEQRTRHPSWHVLVRCVTRRARSARCRPPSR